MLTVHLRIPKIIRTTPVVERAFRRGVNLAGRPSLCASLAASDD